MMQKSNNPIFENLKTNIGDITIFCMTAGNEKSILDMSNNSENTNTHIFYELLTMVCFPSHDIHDGKKPDSPIFKISDVKIIESKYIKKTILLLGNRKDGAFDEIVEKPDYQSSFIKHIIDKHKEHTKLFFENDTSNVFQSELSIPNSCNSEIMESISQQSIIKDNETTERELVNNELQNKIEQNTHYVYRLIGESYELSKKTNIAQEKNSTYIRKQNRRILVVSCVAVIVAIISLFKTNL
jgi:hypothetical protein